MWPPRHSFPSNESYVGLAKGMGILSRIWRVFLLLEERVRREWTFSMSALFSHIETSGPGLFALL